MFFTVTLRVVPALATMHIGANQNSCDNILSLASICIFEPETVWVPRSSKEPLIPPRDRQSVLFEALPWGEGEAAGDLGVRSVGAEPEDWRVEPQAPRTKEQAVTTVSPPATRRMRN